jgi:hypothetical protein
MSQNLSVSTCGGPSSSPRNLYVIFQCAFYRIQQFVYILSYTAVLYIFKICNRNAANEFFICWLIICILTTQKFSYFSFQLCLSLHVKFICTPFTPLHTRLYLLSINSHITTTPQTVFSPYGLNSEHRAFTVDGSCRRRGRRTVGVQFVYHRA